MIAMPHSLFGLIGSVFQLLSLLVFVYVIMDFLIVYGKLSSYHPIVRNVRKIIEPLLAPVRRIMPRTGNIDFSPLILGLILQFLGGMFAGM